MTDTALLAVDVGNTNVTLGVFTYEGARAELAHHWRLATIALTEQHAVDPFVHTVFRFHPINPVVKIGIVWRLRQAQGFSERTHLL